MLPRWSMRESTGEILGFSGKLKTELQYLIKRKDGMKNMLSFLFL